MHDQIPLITSTVMIVVGVLFGILFNQRGSHKLEGRLDHFEARLDRLQGDVATRFGDWS